MGTGAVASWEGGGGGVGGTGGTEGFEGWEAAHADGYRGSRVNVSVIGIMRMA